MPEPTSKSKSHQLPFINSQKILFNALAHIATSANKIYKYTNTVLKIAYIQGLDIELYHRIIKITKTQKAIRRALIVALEM
jgi:hypothetical protein